MNGTRAQIMNLIAVATAAGTACAFGQSAAPGEIREPGDARINTAVFVCPATAGRSRFEFTIRRGPGEMALWLPVEFDRPYTVLSQDFEALVGETFREADIEVTLDQSVASLAVGSEVFADCIADPIRSAWEHAKLSGVDYRATGTNPDWTLELRAGGNLVLRTTDPNVAVIVPTPAPETDRQAGLTHYRTAADGQPLVVRIGGTDCATADGLETTGSSVTIQLGNTEYSGCGRALH